MRITGATSQLPAPSRTEKRPGTSCINFQLPSESIAPTPRRATAPAAVVGALESSFDAHLAKLSVNGSSREFVQTVAAHAEGYKQLVAKARTQQGFDDPQAFVRALSSQELAHLQAVHGLADSIDTASLSAEGAFNLLMSPNTLQDIDKDGFLTTGAARGWQFPPADAPVSVQAAWISATRDMDDGELLDAQAAFFPPVPVDGDPSPDSYLGPDADYGSLIATTLERAVNARKDDPPEQQAFRDRQIAFLQLFQQQLQAYGASAAPPI